MSKHTETKYSCDNCGKRLPTYSNHVVIVTEKDDNSYAWSRLCVTIEHHHGSHNEGKKDPADLCKKCAVALLTDAANRVKRDERVSKGVETSCQLGFNEPF